MEILHLEKPQWVGSETGRLDKGRTCRLLARTTGISLSKHSKEVHGKKVCQDLCKYRKDLSFILLVPQRDEVGEVMWRNLYKKYEWNFPKRGKRNKLTDPRV